MSGAAASSCDGTVAADRYALFDLTTFRAVLSGRRRLMKRQILGASAGIGAGPVTVEHKAGSIGRLFEFVVERVSGRHRGVDRCRLGTGESLRSTRPAARVHSFIDALTRTEVMAFADRGNRPKPSRPQKAVNKARAQIRARGERAIATQDLEDPGQAALLSSLRARESCRSSSSCTTSRPTARDERSLKDHRNTGRHTTSTFCRCDS
jgi:hypothetical protein